MNKYRIGKVYISAINLDEIVRKVVENGINEDLLNMF